jgi:uncharacterized cupredoxin-like copper-binding protein
MARAIHSHILERTANGIFAVWLRLEVIMKLVRLVSHCAATLTVVGALIGPACAASAIKVSLWDKGGDMDMSKNMGMGMGMHANMKMAMMGIKVSKTHVPAGKVTFEVKNISKDVIHEMLVAGVKDENAVLPFNAAENRIDEEAAKDLGEVSELDPGKSGSLTLDLKPGLYVLYCNIPGHFMAGMWTTITAQ